MSLNKTKQNLANKTQDFHLLKCVQSIYKPSLSAKKKTVGNHIFWTISQCFLTILFTHLIQSSFVGANAFDERNGERVDLVRLMSLVDDCEGNAEAERLQVAHFLVKRDDFREEVHLQL